MGLLYRDLNPDVRNKMIAEFEWDVANSNTYDSPRLLDGKKGDWLKLLREATESYDDEWLAIRVHQEKLLKDYELRKGKPVKVASNAHENLAQGEFNRLYVRGVCLNAIAIVHGHVFAYRARHSENPRPDSQAILRRGFNPHDILNDLRNRQGEQPWFGIPNGPNSGLSAYLCHDCGPRAVKTEIIVCRCAHH